MKSFDWLEVKRYKDDPPNQCVKLDIPGIEAHLIFKDGQYCLCCAMLGFEGHEVDKNLPTAKTVAVKLLIYELSRRIHLYQALLNVLH